MEPEPEPQPRSESHPQLEPEPGPEPPPELESSQLRDGRIVPAQEAPATPQPEEPARRQAQAEPESLCCPISRCLFRDPVFVPGSGNTYERASIERFWATGKARSRRRDPLTNTKLAAGESALFTNWHVRREVASFLERQPSGWVPTGWPDRRPPSPKPTTSQSSSRAATAAAAAAEPALGDRQLQSFVVLASLLCINVVVCVLSRRLSSSQQPMLGQPFAPLMGAPPPSPQPTLGQNLRHADAADPVAELLPPVCLPFIAARDVDWGYPDHAAPRFPHSRTLPHVVRDGRLMPEPSDRRISVAYYHSPAQQHCLSPRRCTTIEDRNVRMKIVTSPRLVDGTTLLLFAWAAVWLALTFVWSWWSLSIYWSLVPEAWRGEGEDDALMLLPTSSLSVVFTAPFWAIGATLVMQCGVAAFARAELELAPTDWSMTVTVLGFELDRASGDIDSVLGLSAVDVPVWVAWPLGGVRDGDGGTAFELDTREARHEFGQGLSRAGTQRIVDAALEYLCYGQLAI